MKGNSSKEKLMLEYNEHIKKLLKQTYVKETNESPLQKQRRIKKLKANYADFFEYYLPQYATSKTANYHKKAAKLISDPISFLIFEVYRSGAKSVHATIGIPLWLMFTGEMSYMLLIGENNDKADELLSHIQLQLEGNQRIINDFGKQHKFGSWAEGDFSTENGTSFKALGLGQSPRGTRNEEKRPDFIVADDLDTKQRCKNPKRVREAVEWIMEDLWGTMDVGKQRFILANNRIHKNSILANLAKIFKNINKKLKAEGLKQTFHHIKVNAVKDLKSFEPTWKEKYTADYWKALFARGTRKFKREYMNDPQEDGAIFKHEFIQYKKILPLNQYDALCFYGDLSYKDKGDFKAMKLWGKKGRELHRIYGFVRRTSRQQVAEWIYDLYEDKKLQRFNIKYIIEGLFAMDEFVNDFDTEGDKRGYYVPVVASKRPKGDKFDRIEGISGFWERRNVWYNIDEKDGADHEEELDQLIGFEKGSGTADDSPDADHGAISELESIGITRNYKERTGKRKKKYKY